MAEPHSWFCAVEKKLTGHGLGELLNTERHPEVRAATAVPTPDWREGSPNKGLQTLTRANTKAQVVVGSPKGQVA